MRGVFGTLSRYVGGRFVLAMLGTLAVCASLIIMIDLVELLLVGQIFVRPLVGQVGHDDTLDCRLGD